MPYYGSSSRGYDRRPVSPMGSSRYETYEVRPSDSHRERENLRRHGTIRSHPAERHTSTRSRREPHELRREPSFDYGVPPGVDISMFETRGVPREGRSHRERPSSPNLLSRMFGGLSVSRSSSSSRRQRNHSPPEYFDNSPPRRRESVDELDLLGSGMPAHRLREAMHREPDPYLGNVNVHRRGSERRAPHYSPQQAYVETYQEEAPRRRRRHEYPQYEFETRAVRPDYNERPHTRYR